MATIARIYRYPVKGLSPEPLESVVAETGCALPHDRRFALALPDSPFDPAHPVWMRKTHFLMLMRDEHLATLRTHYDPEAERLEIRRGGVLELDADLGSSEGRAEVEAYVEVFLAESGGPRGRPRLVEAPGHVFTDDPVPLISVINLATAQAIEAAAGAPVDPLRFRSNLYIEGLEPWAEFGWVGNTLAAGDVRFACTKRIDRCAATNVDPATGIRDLNLPLTLRQAFGHIDCGVLLEVTTGGHLRVGDTITLAD